MLFYLCLQELRLIGKMQSRARKGDFTADLLPYQEVPAGELQLAEKQIQRCSFLLGLGKIGHGVQTGFQQMRLELVVGIGATRPVMLINNQGFSAKAGGADTSRQTREASTNDDELVIRHGAWLWW